jgi:hypothetical protein
MKSYPYVTHLDIKFPSLDLIDVEALAKSVTDQWYNQTLCRVNDSVVRLGVMQGEYHWHKHDNDDNRRRVVQRPMERHVRHEDIGRLAFRQLLLLVLLHPVTDLRNQGSGNNRTNDALVTFD